MSIRPYLLALGSFAVGSTTYVISGILPAVAESLDVTLAQAGQLATVFALTYAVAAPIVATLTGRWERRTLLIVALLVLAAGTAVSAVATTYPLVLAGRVIAAIGASVYTPGATAVAATLLGPARGGRAVSLVFSGLTVALFIGVPVGSVLSGAIGFGGVFAVIAVVAVVAAGVIRLVLPRVPAPPPVGLRTRFAVAADRQVLTILAMTVLGVLATMAVYIYVVPLVVASADAGPTAIGIVLGGYGLGALIGNAAGGRATDRFGSMPTLVVAFVGFVLMVATLPLTTTTVAGAAVALFVWSVFTWMVNPAVQNLLLARGPHGGLLLSLNASAIFLGAGLSGLVGGVVVDTLGVLALPAFSTVLGIVTFVLLLTLPRAAGVAEGVADAQQHTPTPTMTTTV